MENALKNALKGFKIEILKPLKLIKPLKTLKTLFFILSINIMLFNPNFIINGIKVKYKFYLIIIVLYI
jgi:hypothetical protein